MKYVLMLVCFAFGNAYAAESYVCSNLGTIPTLGAEPNCEGEDLQSELKLKIEGNSVHMDNVQLEADCEARQSKTVLHERWIEDAFYCEGPFRNKLNGDTFIGSLYINSALRAKHLFGRVYRFGKDKLVIFDCNKT